MIESRTSQSENHTKKMDNSFAPNRKIDGTAAELNGNQQNLNSRLIALNKSNAIIEFDLKGKILFVNDLFLELLGYQEHEVLGQHHSIFVDTTATDKKEYDKFWDNLRKGNFQQDEFRRVRKDGKSVWLRGNYNPIFNADGLPETVLKIATDITLTKTQQIEIDAITTAIYKSNLTIEFDLEGRILKANDSFLETMGYSLEEVEGELHSIFVDKDYEKSSEYLNFWENLKNGEYQSGEYMRKTKTGNLLWIQGNYNPIFDTQGKPYKVIKIASDITKQKKQQIEIDAIKLAIYKSSLAIEFDMNGIILSANSIFENIMGYRIDEIVGKHHEILIDKEYGRSREYKEFWNNLRNGQYQEGEFGRVTKDGSTVYIKGNYNPILDAQGKPYKILKIATDVSIARNQAEELVIKARELELKQLQLTQMNQKLHSHSEDLSAQHQKLQRINIELEQKTEALEQKNKEVQAAKILVEQKTTQLEISSKYKSEFLANMSHELRTPLNSLLILSQDLAANNLKNLTTEQVESSEVIYRSGHDLLTLINEVLDLSKIEAGKMSLNISKLSIEEIVKNLYLDFRHQAEKKNLAFKIFNDSNLPTFIITDKQRLEQVLRNIVANAIKFTTSGGVEINLIKSDDNLCIKIKDSGIGISVAEQSSIFEPFHQADSGTSRKYGGTGLGLSISRDLIKLLEGEISLESKPTEGSTFTITIPLSISNKAKEDAKFSLSEEEILIENEESSKPNKNKTYSDKNNISRVDSELLKGKKILVVDDDMRNVFAMSKILRDKGMEVLKGEDGNAALKILGEEPAIDIVLMDIMMPDMNGYEAMRIIRKQSKFKNLPIISLTAKAMKDDEQKCFEAGSNGYLAKPIDVEKLLTMMCTLIKKNHQTI